MKHQSISPIFSDNDFPVILKMDVIVHRDFMVIATYYHPERDQYITYKNRKAIGWSSDCNGGLGLHRMFREAVIENRV